MGETSKIEWTDATFNPWVGCTKVSPGCDNCYAEGWAKRSGMVTWGRDRRRTSGANWRMPVKLHTSVPDGERRRVFCASLADVFDNEVPPEWRADLFELIRATPRLDWLLLTKRIGNVKAMLPPDWGNSIFGYNNVWLGISVVNQDEANRDIPKLRAIPASCRFLSIEPLIAPIDLKVDPWQTLLRPCGYYCDHDDEGGGHRSERGIEWVIVGGESGPRARPMEYDWARSIMVDCERDGVAFFMKQGSQANWPAFKDFASFPEDLRVREWPMTTHEPKVGDL